MAFRLPWLLDDASSQEVVAMDQSRQDDPVTTTRLHDPVKTTRLHDPVTTARLHDPVTTTRLHETTTITSPAVDTVILIIICSSVFIFVLMFVSLLYKFVLLKKKVTYMKSSNTDVRGSMSSISLLDQKCRTNIVMEPLGSSVVYV
jgi:hypothetical protein